MSVEQNCKLCNATGLLPCDGNRVCSHWGVEVCPGCNGVGSVQLVDVEDRFTGETRKKIVKYSVPIKMLPESFRA